MFPDSSLGGGEADDLLFDPDGERALGRRQESFLHVFLGAGSKIAAATQVELALNIFAMALNRFNTETEANERFGCCQALSLTN